MKRIPLHRRDGSVVAHALVSDKDYVRLGQWRWRLSARGYAIRTEQLNGRRVTVWMHRAVKGIEPGDPREVDHVHGVKLDNRRSQLRIAWHQQNGENRTVLDANNTSGFRGVTWHRGARKWMAQVEHRGQKRYLGLFPTALEAANVAATWRAEHMPYSMDATHA